MSEWTAEGPVRELEGPAGQVTIQYLRGPGNVGAHEVVVDGEHTLTMLPNTTSTARKRTGMVSVAVGGKGGLLATLIGELMLAGATNLLVDGKSLLPNVEGRWLVELADAGEVKMTYWAGRTE